MATLPPMSFVVPAHNEALFIAPCVRSIRDACAAIALEHEIIVVDDASTDGTAALALAEGVMVVDVALRHIAAVRNAGAARARFDRLCFVDADSRVDAPLVAAAVAALDDGAIGGGAGVRYDEPVPGWVALLTAAFMRFMRLARWAAGSFVFCRRDAFERVGGFDETFYAAEEIALSRALKKQGRFVVLPLQLITSARKVHGRSALQIAWMMTRLALRGPGALRNRRHLDFWYRDRR
jgi:glycosyltransferase involved in cell wall biosynthesis